MRLYPTTEESQRVRERWLLPVLHQGARTDEFAGEDGESTPTLAGGCRCRAELPSPASRALVSTPTAVAAKLPFAYQ